jgi:hypothetical protein
MSALQSATDPDEKSQVRVLEGLTGVKLGGTQAHTTQKACRIDATAAFHWNKFSIQAAERRVPWRS